MQYRHPVRAAVGGAVYPGAALTVYVGETDELAALYAEPQLQTRLSNPLTADAAGRWPPIYTESMKPLYLNEDQPLDDSGAAMPGATLTLYAEGTTEVIAFYTADENGEFEEITLDDALRYRAVLRDQYGRLVYDHAVRANGDGVLHLVAGAGGGGGGNIFDVLRPEVPDGYRFTAALITYTGSSHRIYTHVGAEPYDQDDIPGYPESGTNPFDPYGMHVSGETLGRADWGILLRESTTTNPGVWVVKLATPDDSELHLQSLALAVRILNVSGVVVWEDENIAGGSGNGSAMEFGGEFTGWKRDIGDSAEQFLQDGVDYILQVEVVE